jgi:glycine betaine transporter
VEVSLGFVVSKFGWVYLLACFTVLVFCLIGIFGSWGDLRLGLEGESPEFGFRAWISMLFSAGMGIGLIFYGVFEPLTHLLKPPLGQAEPSSPQAAFLALRYTIFHWGFHPWSIYALLGLGLAWVQFRLGKPAIISNIFLGLGIRESSLFGKIIDAIAVLGVVFGVATSLGMGALQIHEGLSRFFSVPKGLSVTFTIILITSVCYMVSASTGIGKGIRFLSFMNMILAGILVVVVLFVSRTDFLIEILFTSIGNYLQNFLTMSFRMAPFSDSSWLADWTFFYWAWWISWAPFVGSFIARISKGRTIREFLIGVLVVPTLLSAVWFSILGGSAIYQELFLGADFASLSRSSGLEFAIFDSLGLLPLGQGLSLLCLVLLFVFFVTSADSAVYVLGVLSSGGNPNPSLGSKILWGCFLSGIAMLLLGMGGLESLQSFAILISVPFAILLFFMVFSMARLLSGKDRFSSDS